MNRSEITEVVCDALSEVGCYALTEDDVSDSLATLLSAGHTLSAELTVCAEENREAVRHAIWMASLAHNERAAEDHWAGLVH